MTTTTSPRVPFVPCSLLIGGLDAPFTFDAFVDTGFERGLALPAHLAPGLPAPYSQVPIRLADGTVTFFPFHIGHLQIGAAVLPVGVTIIGGESDLPLLGLDIVMRFRVTIDHARAITFEDYVPEPDDC